eukprot:4612066-Amphidinium_carterae.1
MWHLCAKFVWVEHTMVDKLLFQPCLCATTVHNNLPMTRLPCDLNLQMKCLRCWAPCRHIQVNQHYVVGNCVPSAIASNRCLKQARAGTPVNSPCTGPGL